MDFEIEGDDDDFDYDWADQPQQQQTKQKPSKPRTSYFGSDGNNGDDDMYDFAYEKASMPMTKKRQHLKEEPISTFSPVVKAKKSPNSASEKEAVVVSNESALERAQNMLNKYSSAHLVAPKSHYKNNRLRTLSEEDISISSNDDSSNDDFDISGSQELVAKKSTKSKTKKTAAAGGDKKKQKSSDINELGSKAIVTVSMGEGSLDEANGNVDFEISNDNHNHDFSMDDDDDFRMKVPSADDGRTLAASASMKQLHSNHSTAGNEPKTKFTPQLEPSKEGNYSSKGRNPSNVKTSSAKAVASSADHDDYSDEGFDQEESIDEYEQSALLSKSSIIDETHHDKSQQQNGMSGIAEESVQYVEAFDDADDNDIQALNRMSPIVQKTKTASQEDFLSPKLERENTSFSRLSYGDEDDDSVDAADKRFGDHRTHGTMLATIHSEGDAHLDDDQSNAASRSKYSDDFDAEEEKPKIMNFADLGSLPTWSLDEEGPAEDDSAKRLNAPVEEASNSVSLEVSKSRSLDSAVPSAVATNTTTASQMKQSMVPDKDVDRAMQPRFVERITTVDEAPVASYQSKLAPDSFPAINVSAPNDSVHLSGSSIVSRQPPVNHPTATVAPSAGITVPVSQPSQHDAVSEYSQRVYDSMPQQNVSSTGIASSGEVRPNAVSALPNGTPSSTVFHNASQQQQLQQNTTSIGNHFQGTYQPSEQASVGIQENKQHPYQPHPPSVAATNTAPHLHPQYSYPHPTQSFPGPVHPVHHPQQSYPPPPPATATVPEIGSPHFHPHPAQSVDLSGSNRAAHLQPQIQHPYHPQYHSDPYAFAAQYGAAPPPPPMPAPYYFGYPPNSFQQQAFQAPMDDRLMLSMAASMNNPFFRSRSSMMAPFNASSTTPFGQTVQQPLVLDLLQELRRSREEAAWAKQRLAEAVMRMNTKEQQSDQKHADNSAGESNLAVKSGQSPRSALRKVEIRAPVAQKVAATVSSAVDVDTGSFDEYADEEYEDEDNSDDGEGYSSDFEQHEKSTLSVSFMSKGAKKSSDSYEDETQSKRSPRNNSPRDHHSHVNSKPTIQSSSKTPEQYAREVKESSGLFKTPATDREQVLRPMKESLARSLLESQEMFRSQIESIKMRLKLANRIAVSNPWDELIGSGENVSASSTDGIAIGSKENCATDVNNHFRSSYEAVPSLSTLKKEFDTRREKNTERMFDVLMQVYPDMDLTEARKLAMKF